MHKLEIQVLLFAYVCLFFLFFSRNVPPEGVSRRFVVHHHSSRIQPATYVAAKFTSSDDNWKCSNLYYKSKYLYIQSTQSSLSLYQDFLIKRPYHTTAQLLTEASKDLKQKESSDSVSSSKTDGDKTNVENVESAKGAAVVPKKETLRDKIIGFIQHYYNGFKLFFVELRICIPLMYKYLKSGRSSLKRREHMQVCFISFGIRTYYFFFMSPLLEVFHENKLSFHCLATGT